MKNLIPFLSLALSVCFLTACQPEHLVETSIQKSEVMSPEAKQALAPNSLFLAVIDQVESEFLKEIIDTNGEYLLDTNEDGDTPLGFAIKSNHLTTALLISKYMDPRHYQHQNNQGESYLYLSSKKGFIELIQFLSIQFYDSHRGFFDDYEFTNLDLKTNEGERALHVAKNYLVAETLKTEYHKGFLEYPLRAFKYLQNNQQQTFLHTAVRNQNSDLLKWGLEEECNSQEESFITVAWESIQKFGKVIALDWDNLINTQDVNGLTALNYAAKMGYLNSLSILSTCKWNNYLLADNEGNIPLQNFLLSLDPLKAKHNKEVKDLFSVLLNSQTKLSFKNIPEHVDSVNNNGNTSLHIAAHLNDPYFYNELKRYGHVENKSNNNKTAKQIFTSHQNLIPSL